ncbi:MAG: hypothetical protein PHS14_01225 [Elusimicrobia bacterium]|nr:hypothetical protein [Elusimicrobiota bacterium]
MLTLLAALFLSGPPAARAEGPPAAQAPALDAADENGDGIVSGKERRRKRRADRRARRGDKGPNGEIMSDEQADAADAAESSARGSAASGKAATAAAALKGSLPSADAGGGIPGSAANGSAAGGGRTSDAATSASAGRSATAPADGAQKPSGNPGSPKAPSDFALAARSGYAPAFAAAGLKLGPDGKSVLRLDGKPATPEDYARLQKEIASMPAALGRRPDFFSVVSPEHYAGLKRGYNEKKDDPVYKDVGTTEEDRDFVHTASCSKLSGDCNKSVEKASYKKGDFVAPEDLDSMWNALQKELDGSAEGGGGGGLPDPGAARSQVAREKAMDAARALSDGKPDDAAGSSGAATTAAKAPDTTPVSQAVASVRRLWKNAALALPGTGGSKDGGSNPLLPAGALALAALAARALFMRRKE